MGFSNAFDTAAFDIGAFDAGVSNWPFTTHLQEFRTSIQRAGFVEVTLTATPATTEWTALELWVTGSDDRAPSRNRQ